MKHNKRCQSEHAEKLGFYVNATDAEGIPIGICSKPAKHSIISKESDVIGGKIKQMFRFCDEHFYGLKESYEDMRFSEVAHKRDHHENHKEGSVCPDCGDRVHVYHSRLRFRENRL